MAKRSATRELNHDNWDQEDEEEDAGTWKSASSETIQGRVIKQARRKLTANSDGEKKNVFAGFDGFRTHSTPVSNAFGPGLFQLKKEALKENAINSENHKSSESNSSSGDKTPELPTYEEEYLASLKALNETVSKWIADHVQENSLCVLIPVFRDYEKHLEEINLKRKSGKEAAAVPVTKLESTATAKSTNFQFNPGTSSSPSKPSFSFTNTNAPTSSSTLAMFDFKPAITATTSSTTTSPPSSQPGLFSFGTSKPPAFGTASPAPFSFGFASAKPPVPVAEKKEEAADAEGEGEEDDDTPPKVEVKPIQEDDAYHSIKCKLFYKKDDTYADRGVGTLHLKKTKDGKTQLVIRADTSLGNILLNIMMNSQLAPKRMGKNNVMMVCIPNPPFDPKSPAVPTPLLFRVKTGEEADELLSKLEEAKN